MTAVNRDALLRRLTALLSIPSPTGMTDTKADWVLSELATLGIIGERTDMGAVRAVIPGRGPARAFSAHLDTLGAMVRGFGKNGRPQLVRIGTWAARFAEGARARVHCRNRAEITGTIMPLKSSGHIVGEGVDNQPANWENLELRPDGSVEGIGVGDWVSIDPQTEVTDTGYVVSRFLDNAAAVAALLTAVEDRADRETHLLFPVREEVGTGANHLVLPEVAELVALDLAPLGPGQNGLERGVTLAAMDASGPFDRALMHRILSACEVAGIPATTDVFRFYRSDALAALNAGADIRTALLCYGCDGSHGWERVHLDSIEAMARACRVLMK